MRKKNANHFPMDIPLGWRDILRPIRDGYRHLFPSPDTGPTPEERRKQRKLDQLKGFTYFDTFEQLEEWTEACSDPLQRANTPLLQRQYVQGEAGKARVLLVHDHAGNYHDYESVQRNNVDGDFYTCEYLQYVDTFVYFSHKLVCVPPPTWANILHRNGVLALGTIVVEPQTEGAEKLLEHTNKENTWAFPVVAKLVAITRHYGFDGWLINIEKPFPTVDWRPDVLNAFLSTLRYELGTDKRLIWYDALTASNKISYQNALNEQNGSFAKTCGNILTNYCWDESDARSSVEFAQRIQLEPQNIFFGIDVWAQNATKSNYPRVTYPKQGGGGTNTGIAVAKLAELGLSAGIFAPAWSFEHFPNHGKSVEQATWEGTKLPEDIDCSCGNCSTRHRANLKNPIIGSTKEFAAGSESFFHTDFARAFGKHINHAKDAANHPIRHAQLGAQSILPRPFHKRSGEAVGFSYHFEDLTERTRLIIKAKNEFSSENEGLLEQLLPLYKLNMPANGSIILWASCRNLLPLTAGKVVQFYLKSTVGIQFIPLAPDDGIQKVEIVVGTTSHPKPHARLQELGVQLQGSSAIQEKEVRVLEISNICLAPRSVPRDPQQSNLRNVHIERRGGEDGENLRLCWSYDNVEDSEKVDGIPHSEITGRFSYFSIRLNNQDLGRAYALEYPIYTQLVDISGKDANISIVGIGFDGQQLAETKVTLSPHSLQSLDM